MTGSQLATALAALIASNGVTPPAKAKTRRKGYHQKPKAKGSKLTDAERAVYQMNNDAECIKVFEKAGFKDVKPRVNVLTYNKWIEKGRKVKKGEKSHRVNGFSLFHEAQTEPLTGAATVESPAANTQAA